MEAPDLKGTGQGRVMRVELSRFIEGDLDAIVDYIAQDNPLWLSIQAGRRRCNERSKGQPTNNYGGPMRDEAGCDSSDGGHTANELAKDAR